MSFVYNWQEIASVIPQCADKNLSEIAAMVLLKESEGGLDTDGRDIALRSIAAWWLMVIAEAKQKSGTF